MLSSSTKHEVGYTLVPLFLAGSGRVLVYVPVTSKEDRIVIGRFNESCSSCCVVPFRSGDLALKLDFLPVMR